MVYTLDSYGNCFDFVYKSYQQVLNGMMIMSLYPSISTIYLHSLVSNHPDIVEFDTTHYYPSSDQINSLVMSVGWWIDCPGVTCWFILLIGWLICLFIAYWISYLCINWECFLVSLLCRWVFVKILLECMLEFDWLFCQGI